MNAIAQASENAIANALDVATECATHARVAHTCCCYVMRINKCNAVAIALIAERKTTKIIIIKTRLDYMLSLLLLLFVTFCTPPRLGARGCRTACAMISATVNKTDNYHN